MRASMMNSKKEATRHRTQVAAFGAALGSLAVGQAAPAEASVVDLTSVVNTVSIGYGGVSNGAVVSLGAAGSFFQFNDPIGKTLSNNGGGIFGFVSALATSNLTANRVFDTYFNITAGADGIRTFGFQTDLGQLGWIRLDLGGAGGAVHYLAAAFNDEPGAPIHVGSTDSIPEPATTALLGLSLLAMGARGVRRLREQRKPTGTDATS